MTDKKKLIGIYLPVETLRKLKVFAAQKFLSVSVVVEEAVKEFLKKENKGNEDN